MRRLLALLLAAGALKIVVGGSGWVAGLVDATRYPGAFPPWVHVLHVAVFSIAGVLLVAGGRRDMRTRLLGAQFFLLGASFSDRLLGAISQSSSGPQTLVSLADWCASLQPEAFIPLLTWLFVRRFPTVPRTPALSRFGRAGVLVSAVVGSLLFAVNLSINRAWITALDEPTNGFLLRFLVRLDRDPRAESAFWQVLAMLVLTALIFMVRKMRHAAPGERHRVTVFAAGLVGGVSPIMVDVVLESTIPRFQAFMEQPLARQISGLVCYSALLSVPFATGYAVVVRKVLGVRLVVRKAIRYALARVTAVLALGLPLAGLAYVVYQRRDRTIGELFWGPGALALAAATIACALVFKARRPIFDAIDRRFFREQYDARTLLASVAERARSATEVAPFAVLLAQDIDRALHVRTVSLLVSDPSRRQIVSPLESVPPLPLSSPLVTLLGGDASPLDLDLDSERSPLSRLDPRERRWIRNTGFELIVPLIGSNARLVGAIALGARKSEQPYTGEDRVLLTTIATAAALRLENLSLRSSSRSASRTDAELLPPQSSRAGQCRQCGLVQSASAPTCAECGGQTREALLPERLLDKFAVKRQIGAGGMGIVYLAVDEPLGRRVALKTLPGLSASRARRLRREARAMAHLSHPNLAVLYGMETWNELPILVVEYLAGGTLADRLRRGPVSIADGYRLARVLASTLGHLHEHRMLHRDVKPSNVGFTSDQVPKLLDFGLVRALDLAPAAALADAATDSTATGRPGAADAAASATLSHQLIGTFPYLSPEALRGEAPGVGMDLWALGVTIYEALTGTNPFRGPTLYETADAILTRELPDIRERRPDCPSALAETFSDWLHKNASRRPGTGSELNSRLDDVEPQMAGINQPAS